ncbi:MAG TPA: hypothetical protein PLZ55_14630 [bacterium]|nr:hypothetical protein [bacterium]
MTLLDELDPWEQERLRLQTGTTISHGVAVTTVLRRGEAVALSKEEFEELKKRISILKQNLISILGTYGRRLSGLSAQERIAFVVFGRGGRTRAVVGSMSMPSSVPLFAEDEDKVRGDLERARLDMQKAADEMRTLRKMPWLSEGTGDSDTTLVFSALVSGLPQTPPAETTESADWVEVIAY